LHNKINPADRYAPADFFVGVHNEGAAKCKWILDGMKTFDMNYNVAKDGDGCV
jgi:hypothetical protein